MREGHAFACNWDLNVPISKLFVRKHSISETTELLQSQRAVFYLIQSNTFLKTFKKLEMSIDLFWH